MADHASGVRADPRTYEDKLIAALRGPLPDRRLLAARILGRLRSRAAIGTLEVIAREREDPYLAAEAARALAAIDPDLPVVTELARAGPVLARRASGRCALGGGAEIRRRLRASRGPRSRYPSGSMAKRALRCRPPTTSSGK
ncbi:MAG TPA: HEAT repeat domain-containing protein [Vicinamibacteria bacterium]|nr:HEAT repeat domain-containing protein [Vicinamibacteria bacterium]